MAMGSLKGIILAGGRGTRLHPLTIAVSKQLLPVYNKPMIYYPLTTLMLAGIKEILIITTPDDEGQFRRLLGDGSQWGIFLAYEVQDHPSGVAESFIIAEEFIGDSDVALILGDNLFHGHGLGRNLQNITVESGAYVFAYEVPDPGAYGVVEFDSDFKVLSIEEKPKIPKSNHVIPGLYFFDNRVSSFAKALVPSARGELEITELILKYLELGQLKVEVLGRGVTWLDTGTIEALFDASEFVRVLEKRQGFPIGQPGSVLLD
jgi:glucose-1-phosphate thymidylyltransferase